MGERPTRFGYAVAVLVIGVVVALKSVLASLPDHPPFLLFLAAVMVASWYGGFGPGLLATVLATVMAHWLFLPPPLSPASHYGALALFCGEGLVVGGLGAFLQAARGRAERAEAQLRRDLDERVQIEEALRRSQLALRETNRRKDQFLGMLSHELRNPLAALANAIALVRRGIRTDEAVAVATRQIQRLGRMVDDLLDVSRITRGKVALERDAIDLRQVVESAVQAARPTVAARGQRLSVTLPPEPLSLVGDCVRLEQVLGNLLDNAAKYTAEGGEIAVSAEHAADELVVRVRDTGIGIAADELPQIFEVFVQGERSLDRAGGGLGIGLSVVRSLVEMHGGRVEAHSAGRGCGSEFVVRLPASAATAPRPPAPRVTPAAAAHHKLLVVDDDPDVLRSLTLVLTGFGYDAQGCSTGEEALEVNARSPADVILLDIGLPGMDGYQLARRLCPPPGARRPVLVALSGYGHDHDRQRAREAGFAAHLCKPIDPDVLHAVLAGIAAGAPAVPAGVVSAG